MKRIISTLLAVILVLPAITSVSAVEKSAGLSEDKIINIVDALEIMQGDENGNLNLENNVTRAEFVKMAVSASNYKDDADVKGAFSIFPDVQASHWAAGYIRIAVGAGWIRGYLDGTFRPSGNVKLEEAATIVLKLLGYTESDFVGSYPDGQMAKYRSLKLDTNINAKVGDTLTRRECMNLLYNTLCTYTKNGQSYAATLGYTADNNGNIDYSALVEKEKEGPYIVKDLAQWKNDLAVNEGFIYYKNGKVVNEEEVSLYDVLYYSPEFSSVWIYEDKTAGIIESFSPDKNSPTSVTVSGTSYSVAGRSDYVSSLSDGKFSVDDSVVLLFGEKGVVVDAFKADAPAVAAVVPEGTKNIYVNDVYTAELKDKALIYYCAELESAFCYDKNASGVVSALAPTKQDPASIVLGSKTYALSGNTKKLFKNESSFGEKDFVTVYFGKNGQIEYVEKADIYDTEIYSDNGLSYESLVAQTLEGPEIVSGDAWKDKLGFDYASAEYYTNGKKVSAGIIKDYDVIYYSSAFKTVWIYSDKVTGVLEGTAPNAVAPTSVKVGGSSYNLETAQATIAFGGKGSFVNGDTVTLILGASGVVAAVDPSLASNEIFGLVAKTETKESTVNGKTYSDYYITVSSFDGKTNTIQSDNKNLDIGDLVIVRYTNGALNIMPVSSSYANVESLREAVSLNKISPDAVIVDCYEGSYITVYPSRLKEIKLATKNVAYYSMNADGYLEYLVLKDATGDFHSYGVIINFNNTLKYFSSKNITIGANGIFGPVQIKYSGNTAQGIFALSSVPASFIDSGSVKYNGISYRIDDNVECFVLEAATFNPTSTNKTVDEIMSQVSLDRINTILLGDEYTVKGYYDNTGIVRVLVAQKNI